jgi:hypothetical protein
MCVRLWVAGWPVRYAPWGTAPDHRRSPVRPCPRHLMAGHAPSAGGRQPRSAVGSGVCDEPRQAHCAAAPAQNGIVGSDERGSWVRRAEHAIRSPTQCGDGSIAEERLVRHHMVTPNKGFTRLGRAQCIGHHWIRHPNWPATRFRARGSLRQRPLRFQSRPGRC